jgi:uncharacterized membrane protein YagU involved in acid resistance
LCGVIRHQERRMNRYLKAALLGGFIGGALDLGFAVTLAFIRSHGGVWPAQVLRYIAGGLLGPDAFQGGAGIAALGLGLHFFIAICAAGVFVFAATRQRALTARPVLYGVLFGIAMYAVMNVIVLPLSMLPPRTTFPLIAMGLDLLSHMFLFGVPIALTAKKALTPLSVGNVPSQR